ncbi:MAG TPA: metal-dependent transcriptional regulator [Solirubrobacteraceae bacterium]|nr:metal-dependent transcriptional regulator [Solirubrobacteraceae bacterium]
MAIQERAGEQLQGEQVRSPAVEDYCKEIFTLQSRGDQPVSTNALARRLRITPGSVSAMLKKLDSEGLIARVPYRGVRLTPAGRRVALEVIRHHRLLELFLTETLHMPWDRVHAEAEVLEHVISEDLEQLIADKLGDPTRDPHGDPIPSAALELPERDSSRSLDSLHEGDSGVFVRVSDSDPEMLRYLSDHGIAPGERLRVAERQPFGGPLLVSFAGGERTHAIGGQLAQAMRVTLDSEPSAGGEAGQTARLAGGASEQRVVGASEQRVLDESSQRIVGASRRAANRRPARGAGGG